MGRRRPLVAWGLWGAGTVALALNGHAGQGAGPPWLASGLLIGAAAALATGHPPPRTAAQREPDGRGASVVVSSIIDGPWRWALLVGSLVATAALLVWLPRLDGSTTRLPATMLWLAAVAAVVAAVGVRRAGAVVDAAGVARDHRVTLAVLGVALVGAAALRLPALGTVPFTLAGDEASQGLEAVRVASGDLVDPFVTGWLGVPTMSFFLNASTIGLLGQNVVALRLPWALLGIAAVPVTFFVARRAGTAVAAMSAILLATYHVHVHFSRLGSNQIADPLLLALALLMLLRALEQRRPADWVALGCLTGASMYLYAGARLTVLVVGVVLLREALVDRRALLRHRGGLAVAGVAVAVVAAPMIQYAIRFTDDFNARANQVGVFQSGWLGREVVLRGEPALSILGDQLVRAVFGLVHYPDRTVWYGLPEPMLHPVVGAMSLVGLALCTWWSLRRDTATVVVAMTAWWWLGTIVGGALTVPTPSSQRLVTLTIPTCFMIAVAVRELARLVPRRRVATVWMVSFVFAFAAVGLHTHFVEHMPKRIYGGPHAELATVLAPDLAAEAGTTYVVFLGAPAMYWGFATFRYLAPEVEGSDVIEPLADRSDVDRILAAAAAQRPTAVFVVLPERLDELSIVERERPGGTRTEIVSEGDGRLMAITYVVADHDAREWPEGSPG